MPAVCDIQVIQGDSTARIGDGAIVWKKSFNTEGRYSGGKAILMFMVKGLCATESDVDIKINGTNVGKIEHYNGADIRHWFTQIVDIGPGVLNDGNNELQIEAVSWPGAVEGDMYDDFWIKDVVCIFQEDAMFSCLGVDAGIDNATVEHFELTNKYQNLAQVTVTTPSKGFVCLTGSGYVEILNPIGHAWVGISIGKTSEGSKDNAETGVQLPLSAPVIGTYRLPFSVTTVVAVSKGETPLYMVGIKDPNHTCYANGISLTALFIKKHV